MFKTFEVLKVNVELKFVQLQNIKDILVMFEVGISDDIVFNKLQLSNIEPFVIDA